MNTMTLFSQLLLFAAVLAKVSGFWWLLPEYKTVTTTSGKVRAMKFGSEDYYSFKGIPYAEPPVGNLRFRNPVPVQSWSGVRNAYSHGSSCPNELVLGINGDEDCLFLNVYTPDVSGTLPVMIWIHGGSFVYGSGDTIDYGPKYLMEEGVIVVTINYRLGALGFLNTGDKYAQGNYGLKDMTLAIKWVKDNIGAFGGDPQKITLFGQSVGSAAVNLLLLSEMSKGLFQRAIMQSGTALTPFAFRENGVEKAEQLGHNLDLTFDSTQSLIDQLRQLPYQAILLASESVFGVDEPRMLRPFNFVPCVEPDDSLEERFLEDNPTNLLEATGNTKPILIGTTNSEALYMIREDLLDFSVFDDYNNNPNYFVPSSFGLTEGSSDSTDVINYIKSFYFNNQPLSYSTREQYAQFHTDAQYIFPTERVLKHFQFSNEPIYRYEFTFSGKFNHIKNFLFLSSYDGACHSDDLYYLFDTIIPYWPWPSSEVEEARTVRDRVVRLWTNFAKYGNPTPNTDNLVNQNWPPFDQTTRTYLEIGKELTVKNEPNRLEELHNFQLLFALVF
ncbi:CLUMA_CG016445, isoform A [Clunio marinus]|uniref:CLUMA_CG016445, isoform A n=1 Tax=Clunio marinus TaxID=568069 RepID=A0A1J1IUN8_9DIPT|nr:CLUMA_CG016445, isoform A [Clunio marinus]